MELKFKKEISKKKNKTESNYSTIVHFSLAKLRKLPSVDFCCCFLQDNWALKDI